MNLLAKIIPSRVKQAWRLYIVPNRILLETSRDLNFPMPLIRKALITINKINLSELLDNCRTEGEKAVSLPTLSRALHGGGENSDAKTILAKALGLRVEELFPEDENEIPSTET